jgi:glycosyltransferase involved in cell wall biosynthesis
VSAPLVSVVVPAYNHERYLGAALDSLAAQTYPALELVLVDDGSSDGTVAAFERWQGSAGAARRFARIELVRHEVNRGAHASLNDGMARARGEYLGFLNSDDCFAASRVATLVERMRARQSRFAFSSVMPIDDRGERALASPLARRIVTAREEIAVLPSVSFGFLFRQLAISTGNFFMQRSLAEELGGFRALKYCHDWDYALRAFLRTEPVFVDEFLYLYRLHEANSFAALQDVALRETESVLREYYRQCLAEQLPANWKAPVPANWPGVFEYFIDYFELHDLWAAVCKQKGHVRRQLPGRHATPRLSRYSPVPKGEGAPPAATPAPGAWRRAAALARSLAGSRSS